MSWFYLIGKFQSTLPHGERPPAGFHLSLGVIFQSTLPHGERQDAVDAYLTIGIFQSTLPHGERPYKR